MLTAQLLQGRRAGKKRDGFLPVQNVFGRRTFGVSFVCRIASYTFYLCVGGEDGAKPPTWYCILFGE